jgi:hypothetical protein
LSKLMSYPGNRQIISKMIAAAPNLEKAIEAALGAQKLVANLRNDDEIRSEDNTGEFAAIWRREQARIRAKK